MTRISCLVIAASCVCALAQGKGQVIEIPFDFYRNEIVLQVSVNGKGPFSMMLDTGTDPSVVDLAWARTIGLKLDSIGRQGDGGGTDVNLAYGTKLPLVEIGGLSARNIETAALDLSKISARLEKPMDGVLGQSLLSGRIVQIDYPNRVVRFYSESPFGQPASKQPNTAARTVLAFRYDGNVLIDDVLVNGKKVVGNLDTGSNGSFDLTPAAVTYLGLEDDVSRAPASTDTGYNGASANRKGKLRNVTIGGISVDNQDVTFFGKGMGRDRRRWGINIGNVFLKDFVVTIDYRRKLIVLEKRP